MTSEPGAPTPGTAAVQLSHLLGALWRGVTRATKASESMPALESQVSILRMLLEVDQMTPAQLAEELHLARTTISNLLRGLETDGLVERRPSDLDGRSVLVVATPYGRSLLEAFRRGRVGVLNRALELLDSSDRRHIVDAVQPLERLLQALDLVAADPEGHELLTGQEAPGS